ncbi:hypothetical protein SEA_DOXI13_54 [Streptomyces phage Doxi13]|nr:hypothetical protein SEA_DOXI13_54 [Streptomyces phage Doxi13]
MSDTPIFDQLARELNYARMISPRKVVPAYTGASTTINGARPVGTYIDEWNGAQTDESVNAASTAVRGEDDEEVVFIKPIPVTTLAELAKGTHQE